MTYVGDYRVGKTFYHRFTTVNASGVPTTLGNTPSLRYYVNGGSTGFTSGLTLTADFSSVTGQNSVEVIATTSCTGLATGKNVSVMIAAGTVSGVSMVGYPVIEYSLEARSALMSITADLGLYVSADGDVSAIVTAINTIAPARVTAQGIDVGAIVTAINTNVGAIVTAVSTIVPARVTAQGIDVGAIVTAVSTIVPARVTAQGIDVGAIVTAFNTIAAARVTVVSASGLASMFLTDSGTTYAASVTGSPVKEIADNAGGSALTEAGIAAAVWDLDATGHQTQGTFGQTVGDSTTGSSLIARVSVPADLGSGASVAANLSDIEGQTDDIGAAGAGLTALATQASVDTVTAHVTAIRAKVTGLTFTQAGIVDANIQYVNDVQVTGTGAAGDEWGP